MTAGRGSSSVIMSERSAGMIEERFGRICPDEID
jgi:hypothetical protein